MPWTKADEQPICIFLNRYIILTQTKNCMATTLTESQLLMLVDQALRQLICLNRNVNSIELNNNNRPQTRFILIYLKSAQSTFWCTMLRFQLITHFGVLKSTRDCCFGVESGNSFHIPATSTWIRLLIVVFLNFPSVDVTYAVFAFQVLLSWKPEISVFGCQNNLLFRSFAIDVLYITKWYKCRIRGILQNLLGGNYRYKSTHRLLIRADIRPLRGLCESDRLGWIAVTSCCSIPEFDLGLKNEDQYSAFTILNILVHHNKRIIIFLTHCSTTKLLGVWYGFIKLFQRGL